MSCRVVHVAGILTQCMVKSFTSQIYSNRHHLRNRQSPGHGGPRSTGGTDAGAAWQDTGRNKEPTHPELLHNKRCRSMVCGIEVQKRWSNEGTNFIRMPDPALIQSVHSNHRPLPAVVAKCSVHLRCQGFVRTFMSLAQPRRNETFHPSATSESTACKGEHSLDSPFLLATCIFGNSAVQ